MAATTPQTGTITTREAEQVERANASGKTPVVFIHGLWFLPSSWDSWGEVFEEAGYAAVMPSWPDDPETIEEARAHPEVFAGKKLAADRRPRRRGHRRAEEEACRHGSFDRWAARADDRPPRTSRP